MVSSLSSMICVARAVSRAFFIVETFQVNPVSKAAMEMPRMAKEACTSANVKPLFCRHSPVLRTVFNIQFKKLANVRAYSPQHSSYSRLFGPFVDWVNTGKSPYAEAVQARTGLDSAILPDFC